MCPIKFEELTFDHIVDFSQDSTVFAAARESARGGRKLRLFLINRDNGHVYTRNGSIESWQQLIGSDRQTIISRVASARYAAVPVYKINGESPQ